MFLYYCIAGFLLAEIIIILLKIVFVHNSLPFFSKLRAWVITSLGGMPKDYLYHFTRLGSFTILSAFEHQLALIADKPDAEYRKYVKKFIELNLALINSKEGAEGLDIKFVSEQDINQTDNSSDK